MTSVCVYVWGVLTCFNQSDVVILSLCLSFSLSLSLSLSLRVCTRTLACMYVCLYPVLNKVMRDLHSSLSVAFARARVLSLFSRTLFV
jgi:hypothetical protein